MLLMHCLLISFAVRIVHSLGFIVRPSVLHRRRNLKATAPMNQMSTSRKRMSQLLHAGLINAVRSMAATGTACPAGQYRPSTASDIADCTDVPTDTACGVGQYRAIENDTVTRTAGVDSAGGCSCCCYERGTKTDGRNQSQTGERFAFQGTLQVNGACRKADSPRFFLPRGHRCLNT